MNKKLRIFYIIDSIFMIVSFTATVLINNNDTYGLSALESVGQFVMCGVIFLVSLILLIIVFLVNVIIKFHKKK